MKALRECSSSHWQNCNQVFRLSVMIKENYILCHIINLQTNKIFTEGHDNKSRGLTYIYEQKHVDKNPSERTAQERYTFCTD